MESYSQECFSINEGNIDPNLEYTVQAYFHNNFSFFYKDSFKNNYRNNSNWTKQYK